MAPHSSTLAWKIPWTEKPCRLQSMGRQSRTRLSDFTFPFHFHALEKEMATHSSVLAWRIPGTGSLVGCRLWGRTESDTTEVTQQQQQHIHLRRGQSKQQYFKAFLMCILLSVFERLPISIFSFSSEGDIFHYPEANYLFLHSKYCLFQQDSE